MNIERRFKIGLSGAPGSGKSTTIEYFRENRPDVTTVDEAARDFFKENPNVDRTTLETQRLILDHMKTREEAAWAFGNDVLITDRTALDQMVYPEHYGVENADELNEDSVAHLKTYDKLFLCDIEGVPYVTDAVRTETAGERVSLHNKFLHVLEREGIEYELLTGSEVERVMRVNQEIDLFRAE